MSQARPNGSVSGVDMLPSLPRSRTLLRVFLGASGSISDTLKYPSSRSGATRTHGASALLLSRTAYLCIHQICSPLVPPLLVPFLWDGQRKRMPLRRSLMYEAHIYPTGPITCNS